MNIFGESWFMIIHATMFSTCNWLNDLFGVLSVHNVLLSTIKK